MKFSFLGICMLAILAGCLCFYLCVFSFSSCFLVISPQLVTSNKAWGAFNLTNDIRTRGEWSAVEQDCHINILELKACQFVLKAFCKNLCACLYG